MHGCDGHSHYGFITTRIAILRLKSYISNPSWRETSSSLNDKISRDDQTSRVHPYKKKKRNYVNISRPFVTWRKERESYARSFLPRFLQELDKGEAYKRNERIGMAFGSVPDDYRSSAPDAEVAPVRASLFFLVISFSFLLSEPSLQLKAAAYSHRLATAGLRL